MITDAGRVYIKRYLAGQVGSIADSIAFGVGTTTPTVAEHFFNLSWRGLTYR